jgi:3-deoxy-D-manno-octulosonic acid kinase
MLYDSSRVSNVSVAWFDARHWESRGAVEGEARGRGAARFIQVDGLSLVLRPYRRGGLVARVSPRHYLWSGEDNARPFREWLLTYRMHRAGLPVAPPIAAHYRHTMGLYTGALITERLAVRGTLADCLAKESLSVLTWIAIGRVIRRFHEFGVCHADLNVRNILVGEDSKDGIYLIDFDRCSLRRPGLWRDSNLVRLRRSLEKLAYGLPRERFDESDWHALLDGYRQGYPRPREAPPAAVHTPGAADEALAPRRFDELVAADPASSVPPRLEEPSGPATTPAPHEVIAVPPRGHWPGVTAEAEAAARPRPPAPAAGPAVRAARPHEVVAIPPKGHWPGVRAEAEAAARPRPPSPAAGPAARAARPHEVVAIPPKGHWPGVRAEAEASARAQPPGPAPAPAAAVAAGAAAGTGAPQSPVANGVSGVAGDVYWMSREPLTAKPSNPPAGSGGTPPGASTVAVALPDSEPAPSGGPAAHTGEPAPDPAGRTGPDP